MKIVVYTSSTCPGCLTLKFFLTQRGLTFEEKKIEKRKNLEELRSLCPEALAVPVLVVDGTPYWGNLIEWWLRNYESLY